MVRRKHPQPATVISASRITASCWIHNSFSVSLFVFFFLDSKHTLNNTDRETPEFFPKHSGKWWESIYCATKYFLNCVYFDCIHHSSTTNLSLHGFHYFWERCRTVHRWRKFQQPRSVPSSAAFLWLLVVTTETSQLLSAYSSSKQLSLMTAAAHLYKSTPQVQVCSTLSALLWSACDPNLKEPFLNEAGRRKLANKQWK